MKINNPLVATIVFTVLTFLQPALNIFLLPLYLQYFPAEDYGILHLMNNITILVMTIGSLRINSSVLIHYFDFKYNTNRLKDYLGNILKASLIMGVIFLCLSILIGPFFFHLILNRIPLPFIPMGF